MAQWRAGDEESLRRLIPLVYKELRRVARNRLRRERPDPALQTTALVHEAYVCLIKQEPIDFENRAHFFGVCANLIREILVQYARRRKAAKRDAGYKLTLDGAIALPHRPDVDLVAPDDALNELAKLDSQFPPASRHPNVRRSCRPGLGTCRSREPDDAGRRARSTSAAHR